MNQKDRIVQQMKTWNSYHTPGCTKFTKRPINAIFLNPACSIEHEMMKCRMCYRLLVDGVKFITEACDNQTNERADIVTESGERIEIETTPERAERFKNRDITVIKTWEMK
jgi:hypothetical protein